MATTIDKIANIHTIRTSQGSISLDITGDSDSARTVTVLADGKLLVGGYSFYPIAGYSGSPGDESRAERGDYSVVRLNADGSLDTTFSHRGADLIPARINSEDDTDLVMAVQADGKVVSAQSGRGGLIIHRLNTDGSLDTSFGEAGAVTLETPAYYDDGVSLSIDPNGELYIGLRGETGATLTKLDSSGQPVAGFGDNGQLTLAPTGVYYNGNITTGIQPDGSVLLGSWLYVGGYDIPGGGHATGAPVYAVQRLTADGALDTRFGDNGVVYFDKALIPDYHSTLTVQPDGRFLLVGSGGSIIRLNADGSFDTSFGTDGVATFDVQSQDFASTASVTVQTDGKIVVVGGSSSRGTNSDFAIIRLNADGSLDTSFGSPDGKLHVDGSANQDTLTGINADEIIHGLAGDDLLQGNGGRDQLLGGAGADIFRFAGISDSYRTSTQAHSDRILDFDASEDRIDLIALGFSGIGDGHDGTLAIQTNSEGTRTYLKSFEADAAGQRFELVLEGNLVGQLNSTNLVFAPPTVEGTAARDVITASALAEIIQGGAGNDRIDGGQGADVIIGGEGADQLYGGDVVDGNLFDPRVQNGDTFVYTSREDSYRTATQSFSDLIVNFADRSDKIDVSALGYTGFGDGTGSTLKVVYNGETDRTYLKDLDADAQGHRFELALTGDWRDDLDNSDMVFAPVAQVVLLGVADEQEHTVG